MSPLAIMGLGPQELIIILVIVLLLFGGTRFVVGSGRGREIPRRTPRNSHSAQFAVAEMNPQWIKPASPPTSQQFSRSRNRNE